MNTYGVDMAGNSEALHLKMQETMLEKYGGKTTLESPSLKKQVQETNLERYGFINSLSNKNIRNKIILTNLNKYNVKVPSQNEEIKAKIRNTMYKNGTAPTSKQQLYICNLVNGNLNYPIYNCSLDIAFPNDFLYIEYDGGGHDLRVKYKVNTKEEFDHIEMKRQYFLYSKGWKLIRIISSKDYLPYDESILKLIKEAREYLNTGHSWIKYDIDNNLVKCSKYEKSYDFGELRKIN
jgi:very-short-patch-repair endonuclease